MTGGLIRAALLLEQCWHRVPGGTAVAAVELARAIARRTDVEVVGIAASHSGGPVVSPPDGIEIAHLRLPRPLLYESWARLGRPGVDRRCGRPDLVHATGGGVPAPPAPPRPAATASTTRAPKTIPSSNEFEARRLAPWTPVQATSPAAQSPGRVVAPSRSVSTPPQW